VDKETGDELWSFATDDVIRSTPLVADDSVIVVTEQGHLFALDLESGDEVWSEPDGIVPKVRSELSAIDDLVYVRNEQGDVFALDPENGDIDQILGEDES
jgi:eukaryotic-like serine/threonine-protein kinase